MDPWRYKLLLLKKKLRLLKKGKRKGERTPVLGPPFVAGKKTPQRVPRCGKFLFWAFLRTPFNTKLSTSIRKLSVFQVQLMREGDPQYFHKCYRMSPKVFDELHTVVGVYLEKEHLCRDPVSSEERLAMTLRY